MSEEKLSSQKDVILFANDSELVIGLVGAVGAELNRVSVFLRTAFRNYNYSVNIINVSDDIIPLFVDVNEIPKDGIDRINRLMNAGNLARKNASDNSILALGVATKIHRMRTRTNPAPKPRTVHIIRSLKCPAEVMRLREIYGNGFYLIAAHADYERRIDFIKNYHNASDEQASALIERDAQETEAYGQQVTNTFHLADFFIRIDDDKKIVNEIDRILRILHGHPYTTPLFDEYAMFQAFASSLRSADLSRQVGAVISTNEQVIAHGANDCPKSGGGLYWPQIDGDRLVYEVADGRDHVRKVVDASGVNKVGCDSNEIEQQNIITRILEYANSKKINPKDLIDALQKSPIRDLTEYGRVVHAEMEALLSCARQGVSTLNGTLFCTTFPCHNCAKHIISAGIKRVVYIEPYPKSKALEFHNDCIATGFDPANDKVLFQPYVGVGPRLFFDLFSMRHGSGTKLTRKSGGYNVDWNPLTAMLRLRLNPFSYIEMEKIAGLQIAAHERPQEVSHVAEQHTSNEQHQSPGIINELKKAASLPELPGESKDK